MLRLGQRQTHGAIRLLPHYALGVFFVLSHLASGLRVVLIAHGVDRRAANRIWGTGVAISAVISAAIIAGMCGVRIGQATAAAVAEIKNDGARRAELVKDYIELSPAERDATLIVSGTNAARVNSHVREAIGTAGQRLAARRGLPLMDTGLGNRLTVAAEHGRRITFSPMTHTKLSVYEPEGRSWPRASRRDTVKAGRLRSGSRLWPASRLCCSMR
jgi:hypothetical protein